MVPDLKGEATSDDGGSSGSTSATGKVVEHCLWVLSRSALILIIIGIAWFVKIPVDQIIKRDFESDVAQLLRDELFDQVRETDELTREAESIQRVFADAIQLGRRASRPGPQQGAGQASRQATRAKAALDRVEQRFFARKMILSERFELLMYELFEVIGDGVATLHARQPNAPGVAASRESFEAHLELSSTLIRRLRYERDASRRQLRK